jgi:pimeloyl-ACP methyl ester carboxylesterase
VSPRRLIILGALGALVLLLGINAIVVDHETKAAQVDIGRIVRLPGGDDLQIREDGPLTAPTIVLLHGFSGSMHWWDYAVGALAAHYHVIRFDLLGHGGSAKPSGGYTMEHQAQLVDEALARLGVRRALLVGHSMGGIVSTALATRDRALVAGIVLVDSPESASSGELPFTARLGFVPVIGEATRTLATDGLVAKGLQSAFAPGYKVPEQFVRDFWKMTYTSYADSHSGSTAYLEAEPLPHRLAALGLPVLALYGTEDRLVSPASELSYASVPGARVVPIAGVGHSPMVEKPALTAGLILGFAARTIGRGTLSASSARRP